MLDDFLVSSDYATIKNTNISPYSGVVTIPQGTIVTRDSTGSGSRTFTQNISVELGDDSFMANNFEIINNGGLAALTIGYSVSSTPTFSYYLYINSGGIDSINFSFSADKALSNFIITASIFVVFTGSTTSYTLPQDVSVIFSARLFKLF